MPIKKINPTAKKSAQSLSIPAFEQAKPLESDASSGTVPTGKIGDLLSLLRRPEGATLADMTLATGWQAHSVRGAMAGSIKKRLGLPITSAKADRVRTWKIGAEQP